MSSHINLISVKMERAARKEKGRAKGAKKRTRRNMGGLRALIYHLAEAEQPVTVRQIFYSLVSRGVIAKLQSEYSSTVDRLMVEMRQAEVLPFDWVADLSRMFRKGPSYTGLDHALRETLRTYRRDLWANSNVYVEVWCEKDALTGVLYEVTNEYDVRLMPAHGFSSHQFLASAADNIRAVGKPAYVYLLGDHDPSGKDALRHTRDTLTKYVRGAVPVHFEVLAVTPEQIAEWKLPDRPPKKGDSRAKKFKGLWVDLDAIPAPRLRELVRAAIEKHVNPYQLANLAAIEARERETLDYLISVLPRIERPGAAA